MANGIALSFLLNMTDKSEVDASVIRSLKKLFNNRQHGPRDSIDFLLESFHRAAPLNLELKFGADCFAKLRARCKYVPYGANPTNPVWRDTSFTRRFGRNERHVMDNFYGLSMVGFRDEQGSQSWAYETSRWPGSEAYFVVPVYRMVSTDGKSFDFILRPWQQGKDPITII